MAKQFLVNRKRGEKGATFILFTFLTVFLIIPIIGLAIDGSIVMWEKARLAASIDAAALAAGRSLNVALGDSAQQAVAGQIADTYFQANFQPGQMGTTVIPNPDGQQPFTLQTSSGSRKVTVARSVSVPLYFMRILGFTNTTVEFTGQASRKDVNIMLVLDRSGSMQQSGSCSPMIASAQTFVNMFVDGHDSLGLITFQTTANVDFPASTTFKTGINQQLSQLVCAGATSSSWALSLAYDQIKQRGWIGASNVIVFFSDGYPTSVEYSNQMGYNDAMLPTRNQQSDNNDYRYSPLNFTTNNGSSYRTDQEYAWGASSCQNSTIAGVLVADQQLTDPTGYTFGVVKDTQYPISSNEGSYLDLPHLVPAPGCVFSNPPSGFQNYPAYLMRYDVAYIPERDYYGNSTTGNNPAWTVVRFPQDGKHIYYGKIRPDVPANLVYTAFNAADNAAYTIRNDTTYKPIIYSIGLGSQVNDDFMERVANDPRASSYDRSKPAGLYIKAPTAAQLQSAFQQIASQVLRISQ